MHWLCTLCLLSSAAASDDFEAFFKDFAAKRDTIVTLEAHFLQKTILPEEILTTEGTLFYGRPRRIRFETANPNRSTLIDGGYAYEYEPELKQLLIYSMADSPQSNIFFLGFDNDTEAMRKNYDLERFEPEKNAPGDTGILIRPKAEAAEEAGFKEVRLYLREEDYLPVRIFIVNDEENRLCLDIDEMKKNAASTPEQSQIFIAEGTKIIENDRVVGTAGPGGRHVPQPLEYSPPPEAAIETRELAPPEKEE